MCGRFTVQLSGDDIVNLYDAAQPALPLDLPPRYNGAPTQEFAACRLDETRRRAIARLRWGLVPFWAKDPAVGSRLINARAETVHQKPAYRTAFRTRRCLVPASGWYEWQGARGAQAALVHRAGGRLAAVLRGTVGALGQGTGRPRDLHHHHHRGLQGSGGYPSPAAGDHPARIIFRRLAGSCLSL